MVEAQAYSLAHSPFDAVAYHGLSKRTRSRKADPGALGTWFARAEGREKGTGKLPAPIIDSTEIRGSQQADTFRKTSDDYLSELTVSFFRPRARRRAITARPFLVAMRTRNPCVLARWRLFG